MNKPTFLVTGNHGRVKADAITGWVRESMPCPVRDCDCKGIGYQNITLFDVEDWKKRNQSDSLPQEVDIIHIGYWETIKGESVYEAAIRSARN